MGAEACEMCGYTGKVHWPYCPKGDGRPLDWDAPEELLLRATEADSDDEAEELILRACEAPGEVMGNEVDYVVTFDTRRIDGPGAVRWLRRMTLREARELRAFAAATHTGRIVQVSTLSVVE